MTNNLPIKPSRVNDTYVRGTLYHYDRVCESDARQIGILTLPGVKQGSTLRHDGVTVRRLRCGNLNITIESTAGILKDRGVVRFMEALLDPQPHGTAETLPALLMDPSDGWGPPVGPVELDIHSGQIKCSAQAADALRELNPRFSPTGGLERHILDTHPEDRAKLRGAMNRAVEWGESPIVEYRYGSGSVRAVGKIVRNRNGFPVAVSIMISTFMWSLSRARATAADRFSGGDFDVDLAYSSVELSPDAFAFFRALNPDIRRVDNLYAVMRRIHADDVGRVLAGVQHTAKTGEPWDLVFRVGGGLVRSTAHVSAWGADGRPARILGTDTPLAARPVESCSDFSDTLT